MLDCVIHSSAAPCVTVWFVSCVRHWSIRNADVIATVRNLRLNAACMAEAVCKNDTTAMGVLMEQYWALKKSLATGGEPAEVR